MNTFKFCCLVCVGYRVATYASLLVYEHVIKPELARRNITWARIKNAAVIKLKYRAIVVVNYITFILSAPGPNVELIEYITPSIGVPGRLCCAMVALYSVRSLYHIFNATAGFYFYRLKCEKQGTWAVVTLTQDGFGRAFVEAFAKKHMKVVVIGADIRELIVFVEEIEYRFDVEVRYIHANLSEPNANYRLIRHKLNTLDVAVLVNCFGYRPSAPSKLITGPYSSIFSQTFDNVITNRMVYSNVLSIIQLTKIVLPRMSSRRRGAIINVASCTAIVASPRWTVYGACKAFMVKFTEDLNDEYRSRGITMQCLTPGFVEQNYDPNDLDEAIPNHEVYVDSALSTLGARTVTSGFQSHSLTLKVMHIINSISPEEFDTFIDEYMKETEEDTRFDNFDMSLPYYNNYTHSKLAHKYVYYNYY